MPQQELALNPVVDACLKPAGTTLRRPATVPSVSELRRICFKDEAQYGTIPYISRRFVHPYVSIYLTRLFLLAGLAGDTVTVIMGAAGVLGAGLMAGQSAWVRGAGCFLLLASWVLDHTDGEVLRYQGRSSVLGILLDRLSHLLTYPLMHFCLGWSLGAAEPGFRLLGALNAIGLLLVHGAELEGKLAGAKAQPPRPARQVSPILWLPYRILRIYRGTAMLGYGPVVTAGLLASLAAGLEGEYFLLLSFSIYLNVLATWAAVLRAARNIPPVQKPHCSDPSRGL